MGLLKAPHKGQALSYLSLHWLFPPLGNLLPHLPQVSVQMSMKTDTFPQILPCNSSQAPPKMASPFYVSFQKGKERLFCSLLWPQGPELPRHTVDAQSLLNDSFDPPKWDSEETLNMRSYSGCWGRVQAYWMRHAPSFPYHQSPTHRARPRIW